MKEYRPTGHRVFRGGWNISYEVVMVEVEDSPGKTAEYVEEDNQSVKLDNVARIEA